MIGLLSGLRRWEEMNRRCGVVLFLHTYPVGFPVCVMGCCAVDLLLTRSFLSHLVFGQTSAYT